MPMTKELAEIDVGAEDGLLDLIEFLKETQSLRRFCIKAQIRMNNALDHLLARGMDYHTRLPETERKKLMKQAQQVRLQIERSLRDGAVPNLDRPLSVGVFGMAQVSCFSRQHWDRQRTELETDMIEAARLLPIWPWVRSVAGIAELGLAVLVGEAGDIGAYSGPGKLWKRLGLACYDGTRQGLVPAEITGKERAEAWTARGYSPHRRAEVYAFLDDTMLRAQWRGDRDEDGKEPRNSKKPVTVPGHAIGPYGQVYGDRKAWNIARGLEAAHADKEARRFMAKRFIRDLWSAWQNARIGRLPVVAAA